MSDNQNENPSPSTAAHREAEQLRRLIRHLDSAEKQERQELAKHIHGQLQQLLTAAIIRLNLLGMMLADEETKKIQADVVQILNEAVDETRSLTARLSPPVLRRPGFAPALAWISDWMQDAHQLTVRTEVSYDPELEAGQLKGLLLEAVREALVNVAKHAQVDAARLSLQQHDPDHWLIRIEDEGAGCDLARLQAKIDSGRSFSLYSISERLQLMGCQVRYNSAPGQGFRTEIIVPVNPATN